MPYGLSNAPASFQCLMKFVLSGLSAGTCLFCLDDMIIPGKTIVDHLRNLGMLFQRVEEVGLWLNLNFFLIDQVKFSGHVIPCMGISSYPEKIEQWPSPTNVNEVQNFLGLAFYYRWFVSNFSNIASPLKELTRKGEYSSGQPIVQVLS